MTTLEVAELDAVLEVPWQLVDYERWLATQPASDDYLFTQALPRFRASARDVLKKPADLSARSAAQGVELVSALLGGALSLSGVSRAQAERVLSLIDGDRSVAELRSLAPDRQVFERLLELCLGKVLFVPLAVAELEARVSGTELVRFVGNPYEIVRTYWENMVEVREHAQITLQDALTADTALRWLRRLHVVALMGRSLDRFYRPPSRLAGSGIRPGALYTRTSELLDTPTETLILSGPRVGSALLGGEHYQALLFEHDPEALAPTRRLRDPSGLDWGRLVHGRAPDEAKAIAWFLPPRPITERHLSALFEAFADAVHASNRADNAGTLQGLAQFHFRFVRLHPFRGANQSLCMNLVNLLLGRGGAAIPQLLLDQLALRSGETAYLELFRRAVTAYRTSGDSNARWSALNQKKQLSYALIERLQRAPSLTAARELVQAAPDAAAAALLL